MLIRNTSDTFGLVSKILHWLMAILLLGLFSVGLYMTGLDYYDSLYHTLPQWHKSIGLLTLFLLLIRFLWKLNNPEPGALKTHKRYEIFLAGLIQKLFYLLVVLIAVSGYFISTAKGKGIEFFSLFEVPAITQTIAEERADLLGVIHETLAIILIVLVVIHAAAALKHHFIDKDETLKRMINHSPEEKNEKF